MNVVRSWRVAGWVILAAGLLAALVIYVRAALLPAGDFDDSPTKIDIRRMQEIGGEANVLGIEFNSWVASLWHGKRLAFTVAVLSIAGFAICFWSARGSQPRG